MKIDKFNLGHWLSLWCFSYQAMLGVILRWWAGNRQAGKVVSVVLYGHKLNGNLLELHDFLQAHPELGLKPVFLSMDADYCRALRKAGVSVCPATRFSCARLLSEAGSVVSSHGLHSLQLFRAAYQRAGVVFFDVWHGIPFKGFDADDLRAQRGYDEAWVASPLLADLYVRKFGFEPARVAVTGYARTDRLVRRDEDVAEIRKCIEAPASGPLILFAPTWVQDDKGRSLYPFGCSEGGFLRALSDVVSRHQGTVLMRAHLNSGVVGDGFPNVVAVPQSRFPDTEAVLLVADVLVCDWSSIAFDYLVLERPTVFLDVPAPFEKGFSLGPEYRFGPVVSSLDELVEEIDRALNASAQCQAERVSRLREAKAAIYSEYADGDSARRCVERLTLKLSRGESSR